MQSFTQADLDAARYNATIHEQFPAGQTYTITRENLTYADLDSFMRSRLASLATQADPLKVVTITVACFDSRG